MKTPDQPDRRQPPKKPRPQVTLREIAHGEYELVHPPCVQRRADDMGEVRAMLAAGEIDVAVDELRWLLEGCRPLIEAHQLLGQIAVDQGDAELARGHYGMAIDLAREALAKGPPTLRLPYSRPANRPFLAALKGLALSLAQSGDEHQAGGVVARLLALDPSDPLEARTIIAKRE